jgi:hypothetical protein
VQVHSHSKVDCTLTMTSGKTLSKPPSIDKTAVSDVSNEDLVEDAGKVKLEPAQPWGRGIVADVKRTVMSHWVEEMTNFNQKTVAVTLLLFISVIAPTLTFGAVYGKVTESNIGAIEVILGTSWVGMTYSLIGGMPTCVIGSTGPVLAFTTVMYSMSQSLDVPFLTFYAWVSIWLFGYICIASFFDLTRYVKLATRFTDDIFAFLIVSIFVMDAVGDPFSPVGLLRFFDPNHKSHEKYEDDEDYNYMSSALLSVMLGFGTTWLIFFFRGFKTSTFFCNNNIRTSIHDFGVSVSVVIWSLVKEFLFADIQTETLNVPEEFEPTFKCCDSSCTTRFPEDCEELDAAFGVRSWFADLGALNGKSWMVFLAAGPALLAFVLVYLDNGITWHLINHKSHKLQHGEAYNYDLLLSGCFNLVNGMLGLPWLVATTVPCIIHLNGLAEKDQDGKFLKVQETRLTMLFAHLLMALSILALHILKLIPLPVLYGVFLFMGLAALPGIHFWTRFLLWFRQPSLYPDTVYTKYVSRAQIHKYTSMQMIFFFGVFTVINIKAIAIGFPLMTLLCIPARLFLFPKFFKGWELLLLDGEDDDINEWVEAKEASMNRIIKVAGGNAPSEPFDADEAEEREKDTSSEEA